MQMSHTLSMVGTRTLSSISTALVDVLTARRQRSVEVLQLRSELAAARHAASHDPLTSLPNRLAAQKDLARRLASAPSTLVVLLDLDKFKWINDTHGHTAGDDVLIITAARLAAVASDRGFAARLGGDEFLLFLPMPDDPTEYLCELRRRLAEPVRLLRTTLFPAASLGATTAARTANWRSLLTRADAALYHAKQDPTGVVVDDERVVATADCLSEVMASERGHHDGAGEDGCDCRSYSGPNRSRRTGPTSLPANSSSTCSPSLAVAEPGN